MAPFSWPKRPLVMGILNVTPDSFSDGGKYDGIARAIAAATQMLSDGADIIDIGGESTRPGAPAVAVDEELDRTIPVIQAITAEHPGTLISIDTSKPVVMAAALAAGARIINDVNALQADGAEQLAAQAKCGVVLMHRQGLPKTMQDQPKYGDVVQEVLAFLLRRANDCELANIDAKAIAIDPGFGFGKTLEHNRQLLRAIERVTADSAFALLVGVSRKSMFGHWFGLEVDNRDCASAMVAALSYAAGARIVRAHNVPLTVQARALAQSFKL